MKILLAVPSHKKLQYLHLPRLITEGKGSYPPLGVLYLAGMLKRHGFNNLRVFDGQLYKNPEKAFKEVFQEFMPDILGITALTPTLHRTYTLAKIARAIKKDVFIVFGGTHCSLYPQELMLTGIPDALVLGEGEYSFLKILQSLEGGKISDDIEGVILRSNQDGAKKKPVHIMELDSLPFPDRSLVPRDAYYIVVDKPVSATSMLSSRGCPFKCTFCKPVRKIFTQRSPQSIADELEECKRMGFGIVNFVDDTFNINKKNVLEICREIVKRRIGINFSFMGRVDTFDEETAEALREAGCLRIQFGIEAGTDRVLQLMDKGFTISEARRALEISKKYGFTTVAFYILGYPGETVEETSETVKFSIETEPDYVQYLPLSVQPGTPLYESAISSGLIKDYFRIYTLNDNLEFREIYLDGAIPLDERIKIIRGAYRKFYFRRKYIKKHLKEISSPREFFRRLKTFLLMLAYESGV
jgi:radical SAM superfamily enzyme YgiQ (UPF0313 family)